MRRLAVPVLFAVVIVMVLALWSEAGARGGMQAREEQLTILAAPELFDGYRVCDGSPTYQTVVVRACNNVVPDQQLLGAVRFDRANYPAAAAVRLEARFVVQTNGGEYCVRLLDLTTEVPVAATEMCRTATDDSVSGMTFFLRSDPLILASAPHEYAMQARNGTAGVLAGNLFSARLIVEWTEKA